MRHRANSALRRTQRVGFLARRPRLELLEERQLLSTFTVKNANDLGADSLRDAITKANANVNSGGPDVIDFAITGGGIHTISLVTPLPTLDDPVSILGYTQPSAQPNTMPDGTNAKLFVQVLGSNLSAAQGFGLVINTQGVVIDGLEMSGFQGAAITDTKLGGNAQITGNFLGPDASGTNQLSGGNAIAIFLQTGGNTIGGANVLGTRNLISGNQTAILLASPNGLSTSNLIAGNLIGPAATGLSPIPNTDGIILSGGTTGNTIGGLSAAGRDLISGNVTGVRIQGANTTGNLVVGNYVGVDATGNAPMANLTGVLVSASGNSIGGGSQTSRNVISGNSKAGIVIDTSTAPNPSANVIVGNYVGLNVRGVAAIPNGEGVVIAGASGNIVGGAAQTLGNVISGNTDMGVSIQGSAASGNVIVGNLIGTNPVGTAAIANGTDGVTISDAVNTTIGGTTNAARNIISGNTRDGVSVIQVTTGGTGNMIEGNIIGLDATGFAVLPNGTTGVLLNGSNNTLGGNVAGAGNFISGNGVSNVSAGSATSSGLLVAGNFIGTDITGGAKVANTGRGIDLGPGTGITIGGTTAAARNVISGNGADGIRFFGTLPTAHFLIEGNYIGVDRTGTIALGNGPALDSVGILIQDSSNVTVGGTTPAAANVISGHAGQGVLIRFSGTGNVIEGNLIGTNATGQAALGNALEGITVNGSSDIIGGTVAGAGNVISGNGEGGISIAPFQNAATGNLVAGNLIGLKAGGTSALPNQTFGIVVSGTTGTTVGGTTAASRNVVSGNPSGGVIVISGATGNVVEGNYVGTDATGTVAIPNGLIGVSFDAPGNILGGTVAGAGNVISGNSALGVETTAQAAGSLIEANLIGLAANGASKLGNGDAGIRVGGSNVTVGGSSASAGNVISGNATQGILIQAGAANDFVAGNIIGLTKAGAAAVANGDSGIVIQSATGVTIGGTTPASRNVISGNARDGIQFTGSGNLNGLVQNNAIGTDLAATSPLGNAIWGISIEGPSGVTIGGSAATPNVIAFNGNLLGGVTGGVGITAGTGNAILSNNIFQNAGSPSSGLGIDLNEDGVTPNDHLDPDTGPNNLQNYPVLTSALSGPNSTTIKGTLDSTPNTTFTIQYFANDAKDPSGFGEGQIFLGQSQPITTDANGSATFTTVVLVHAGANQFVSAVATDPAGNSSEFSLDVAVLNGATDLALTITAAPEPVQVGQNLVYTITVTNNGPNDATGVTVTDALPATVTYVPPVPAGNQSFSGGVVTANIGTLAGSASATVLITVTPNTPTAPGVPLQNMASVTSVEGDTNQSNNSATASSTVIASADLVLTVTTDPPTPVGTPTPAGSILRGQFLTYEITIANPNGPSTATNVVVSDPVPAGFTIVSATSGQAAVTQNGQLVTGTIANLAKGTSAIITVKVKPTAIGMFTNTVAFSSATADPSPNDDGPVSVTTTVLASADLAVTIAASPAPFLVGQPYTYTVTAINNGQSDDAKVTVVDTLPSSVVFQSFVLPAPPGVTLTQSGQTVTAVFASLASGTMTPFQFIVKPSTEGTITDTATITGAANGPGDPDLSNNTASLDTIIARAADLGVTVTASPNPVAVGGLLQYVVTVTNSGPNSASKVVATDNLPANVMVVSVSPSQGTFSVTGSTVTLAFGSLVVNSAPVTATITVKPLPAAAGPAGSGTITDTVSVMAVEADPVSANNSASVTTTVNASADLAVTLTGTPDPVLVGTNLTYTILITNNGPSTATGVSVQDVLPANVNFISVMTDGTFTQGKNGIIANPMPIASGGTSIVTIVVQTTTLTLPTITDSATVSSAIADPVSSNNSATISTRVTPSSDLALSVTDNPDPLLIGGNLTYTFNVTNNGPSDATTVTLTDFLPTGAVFVRSPPVPGISVGISADGTTFSASLGNLASGTSKIFTLIVRPTTTGQIENTASVTATQADPVLANNTVNTFTDITPSADIAVTASAQPPTILLGQPVTFTFNVVNQGPSDSAGIVLTVVIPTGVTIENQSQSPANNGSLTTIGQTVILSLPTLALGSLSTLTVTGTTTQVGKLVALANVTSTVLDPDTLEDLVNDPNPDDSTTATANVIAAVDLAITQTASANPAPLHSNLTYSVLVTNQGPSDAHHVVLTDVLPAGAQFVSATTSDGISFTPVAGVLTVPLGRLLASGARVLPNGQSALLTIVVSPTLIGTLNNTASVSADEAVTEADTADDIAGGGSGASGSESTNVQLITASGIPGNAAFSAAGYVVDEKAGVATITVNRINGSDGAASVDVATGGGSAVPGVNYVATSASVFFADGQTTATFTVPILDDGRNNGDTVVGLVLSNPTGGIALASPSSALLTIREADSSGNTNPTEAPLQVISLKRFGIHQQATQLVVAFNGPVSASSAQNPANYLVTFPDTGEAIPVSSASYNASTSTVTLLMSRQLDVHKTYQITIRGTGTGAISTPNGNLLDGNRDGTAGGDYVATINAGTLAFPTPTFKSKLTVTHKSSSHVHVRVKAVTGWADHLKARMGGR